MRLKICAAADFHIGMKFARYEDAVRSALVTARMDALKRVVDEANRRSCDMMIIAGDLFDRPNCSQKVVLETLKCLDNFEGKLVALLPGNHDYFQSGPEGLWERLSRDAGDRILLCGEARPYDLEVFDLPAVLYPAPCTGKHSATGSIGWVEGAMKRDGGVFHLGLAHGSIEGISPDFDGRYYPMTRKELEKSGMDLWIVGHTHSLWTEGNVFVPGTPEPDGFDCRHGGSAWIIELEENRDIQSELVNTGTFRFEDKALELRPDRDPVGEIEQLLPEDPSRSLFRLTLRGRLTAENLERVYSFIETQKGAFFYLQLHDEDLSRQLSREEIEAAYPEGSFPCLLLSALADEEEPALLNLAWSLIREASE